MNDTPEADRGDADGPETVHVTLVPDGRAAGQARGIVRETLLRWRLPALIDTVVLSVSELVGNAVRHGRPPLDLVLRRSSADVRVEVHDEDRSRPPEEPLAVPEDAESGRGLLIVRELADDLGVDLVPGDGKLVHASFATGTDSDPNAGPPATI